MYLPKNDIKISEITLILKQPIIIRNLGKYKILHIHFFDDGAFSEQPALW